MNRPTTRASLQQLVLVVDLGGSTTKASTCEYNARGDVQKFHCVTKWPGRTDDIAYVPTIVTQSSKAYSGEIRRAWGWEASNDLSDHGSEFTKRDTLKLHMMEPNKTPEKDEMDSICLFYVRSLLDHVIASRRSESLLILVAVPMLVDLPLHERLEMTNSYKEIFRLASPNPNAFIRIVDEPTVGRIGAKELVAMILAEAGESVDEYTISTSVDSGSTTTVSKSLGAQIVKQRLTGGPRTSARQNDVKLMERSWTNSSRGKVSAMDQKKSTKSYTTLI